MGGFVNQQIKKNLGSLYCKQYGPRSDCLHGNSPTRVHIVFFHDKNYLKCMPLECKKQTIFSDRVKVNLMFSLSKNVLYDDYEHVPIW